MESCRGRPVSVLAHTAADHEALLALATADDVTAGAAEVAACIRDAAGAARVEWWATVPGGEAELVAAAGDGRGRREELALGQTTLVVFGGRVDPRLVSDLQPLAAILRRRMSEERLARTAIELARRNEALEDYAALVAHELKNPLLAALAAGDASSSIEQALDLVDSLLEAARSETSTAAPFSSAGECLAAAVEGVRLDGVEITSELTAMLPLPAEPLRVVLRNLVANAVAAGAHHVHVSAARSAGTWQLFVDDDGSGIEGTGRYASGSGIGFGLCRRIAARFGGALELTSRPLGGTRAALVFDGAPR